MERRQAGVENVGMMTDFWQGRRVFITGASGVIGSWLVKELLRHRSHVTALVRDSDYHSELFRSGDIKRVSVVNGALEDFWTLNRVINKYEPETVFHLGAQTIVGIAQRSPLATFEANIRGTYNLLEACRLHAGIVRQIVVASSDKAYGDHGASVYTENMPLKGNHPYDVSKSCADLLAQTYFRTYALPVAIARCGNVYGGGDLNWSRIVPGTIRSLINGERPIIRSDGTFVRDYIYVKDVVHAYMRLAECLTCLEVPGQAFNFSTEQPKSVLEVVAVLRALMNCTHIEPEIVNTAVGEIRSQQLSIANARAILAWEPSYNLETGLKETVAWYKDSPSQD